MHHEPGSHIIAQPETSHYLCKNCPYTKDNLKQSISLYAWWLKCKVRVDKKDRQTFNSLMIYFWWNVWKEKNRRIFQHKFLPPLQLALLIK
ncbi:hypothetical protein SETIT_7G271200v2 [Setaria italica]|uniref:Uncharacterized protein n=1 Tax=Setaria italica TaxID=4555 RepID=A0A368S1W9_SETIT|nr:hypothetical protein SETIT_7G271200v2 [Setaria italica]